MVYKGVFCRTNYLSGVLLWLVAHLQLIVFSVVCVVDSVGTIAQRLCPQARVQCRLWPTLSHRSLLFLSCFLSYLPYLLVSGFPTSAHHRPVTFVDVHPSLIHTRLRLNRNAIEESPSNESSVKLSGFKLEGDEKHILESGEIYRIKSDADITIRLFGDNIAGDLLIGFASLPPQDESSLGCHVGQQFKAQKNSKSEAVATIKLAPSQGDQRYRLCYSQNATGSGGPWLYAGTGQEGSFQIISEAPLIPIWLQIILIILLLIMSGLFSGLNLGLMALDKNELQVIERCGTEQEKYYAKSISPVRKRGNYLLCTLLLGNVLVNSTLTIFLDALTSGIFAVIASTLSIVIFGEIIPQALCSRHGLAVGAKTIYITYIFMFITFPLSYPISKILDKILGEEIGNVYDRERLMEYIKVTKDYNHLEIDEMNIISGALKFKNISVVDVMTPISDVFMLSYDTLLNFDTMTLINNSGYSRIPVFEGQRDNVVGILHVKDLSLIDPDHNLPLKVVLDFYSHPLLAVYQDVKLDKMLNEFKQGKSHMALVRRIVDNGITDPFFELLGVVTLEDIIEELIQAEINDETDVISDNRRKQKRKDVQSRSNYLDFIRSGFKKDTTDLEFHDSVVISPQLALASFRFLASSVEPFRSTYISEEVLKILMSKSIYFEARGELRKPDINEMSPENVLYKKGHPADYFVMILEGRARIIVTKENQEYDAGPFCCFGINSLLNSNPDKVEEQQPRPSLGDENETPSQDGSNLNISQSVEPSFVPDFTLFCVEKTIYMRVTRRLYQTAIRTTVIEKQRTSSFNKSLSGAPLNDDASDLESSKLDKKSLFQPHLEAQAARFRKISMSTNLPDFGLLHDKSSSKDDVSRTSDSKFSSNLLMETENCKRKLPPLESNLKRSDAVDLMPDEVSPRSPSSCSMDEPETRQFLLYRDKSSEGLATAGKTSRNGSLRMTNLHEARAIIDTGVDDRIHEDETSNLL